MNFKELFDNMQRGKLNTAVLLGEWDVYTNSYFHRHN